MSENNSSELLLSKAVVLLSLYKTRALLQKCSKKDEYMAEIAYEIDHLIGEARYCLTTWTSVMHMYQWMTCLFERSVDYMGNGDRQELQSRIDNLEKAELAIKPFVITEFLDKNDANITFRRQPAVAEY
jgi:hypothetical protein